MDRYEEALAKARVEYEKARKQGYTWLMDLLEGMFPELKESEDEMLMNDIMEAVENWLPYERVEDIRAYLEKQKELPTNDEMLRTLRTEYEKCVADTIAKYERKEQKFTEKQDYSDLTDLERAIHRGFLVVGVENVPVTIIKETAQDCLAQMKPAEWSEADKEMVRRAIFYTEQYRTNYGDTKESEECFNWLLDLHRNIRPPFHSLQQEQESVAERFARIIRGNLIGIDKEVQHKFEQLYLEVTGNKMYGGFND